MLLNNDAKEGKQMTHLVSGCRKRTLHILQTKFADPQPSVWYAGIFFRKRRIIPRLNVVRTEPNAPYSEDARLEFDRWDGRAPWC